MVHTYRKVLASAGLVFCMFSPVFAYSGGSGTEADPYQIGTVSDWNDLMNTPSDWDANFIMTADINLLGVPLIPVGNDINGTYIYFTGNFEGNGHIIRNATINMPSKWHIGLFGVIYTGGQIRNLGVEDVNMSGHRDVAGLAGYSNGTITNCYATGKIGPFYSGSGADCGGLVGKNYGIIAGSHAACDVNGGDGGGRLGGLVGGNFGTINDCYAEGMVIGQYDSIGGLAGENSYLTDEEGRIVPDYIGTIVRCYASGSVSGTNYVGGLVGNHGKDITGYMAGVSITDCYSTCEVTGGAGLLGRNYGHTTNCYAAGKVNGIGGGLVGSHVPTLINCFWDIEATGQTTSGSGTGLTTAQMKTLAPFMSAGWDFVDTWGIGENQTYPFLRTFSGADLNYDGFVNLTDFALFADRWLIGG